MPQRLPRNISIIIIGVIYHPTPPPNAKDGPTIAHITRRLEFLLQKYRAAGVLLVGWRLQQDENVTYHWQLPSEAGSGQTDKEGCHPRQDPNQHG